MPFWVAMLDQRREALAIHFLTMLGGLQRVEVSASAIERLA
jgi:hypothetical protein